MTFEISLIILLVFLNGLFAMSEMAIVSARKVRLQQLEKNGHNGAKKALELAEHPTRFLSTVQVGITSIGIFSGALGEKAIVEPLLPYLKSIPFLMPHAEKLALSITVVSITYLSLIVGELVPKRIALNHPEHIASWIALPMHGLSLIALPAVKVLSLSTELALWLLRIKSKNQPSLSEEEIKLLLVQGTEEGVLKKTECQFMENILRLDDIRVGAVMTQRQDIVWLDTRKPFSENQQRIIDSSHSLLPLCDGGIDNIKGLIKTKDVLNQILLGNPPELEKVTLQALFVPDSLTVNRLLELFKKSPVHMAFVIDEYGDVEGLVTVNDILGVIVGELPENGLSDKPAIVQREDGSWLVDGILDISQLKEYFELSELLHEREGRFYTLGGFVMSVLGHVPKTADHFDFRGFRFEVVDMDGNRVDKVLIFKVPAAG